MNLGELGVERETFEPGLAESVERFRTVLSEPRNQAPPRIVGPGPVLLLGAPGAGKGTQADTLAKMWGVPKISTGDILRANVANGTALGVEANRIMKLGGLVPDRIMNEMVANRLEFSDTAAGFILDGFPRTIRQAQWLDGYLSTRRRGAVLGIINMSINLQRLVERVIHRRVCPLCKTVYNTQYLPPKRMGKCDKDGADLEQRSDDCAEVFQMRLDVFKRETEPLIRYYRDRNLWIQVDAELPPSTVTEDIVSRLTQCRMQLSR